MTRLRIGMLADVAPTRDSGAAGTELSLADELEAIGCRVVRVWGDQVRHRIAHANLHHLLEQPREYRRLSRRLLEAESLDVLHVNQPAGWLAARELRRSRWPGLFVHRSHGFEARFEAVVQRWSRMHRVDERSWHRRLASFALAPLLRRSWRQILLHADAHVVSCSDDAADLHARGAPPETVLVCPQAAPETFLSTPPTELTETRLRRVLYVGQFAFVKAPMIVGDALTRILRANPTAEATWVCSEPDHQRARKLIDESVWDRVRFLAWQQREELKAVYDNHGVLLFPSFAEGFGKVFVEGMARGLCVVATSQGGARDWIRSGLNGELVPVGDANGVADAALRFMRTPDYARRTGQAARITALGLTWRGAAAQLAEFYESRLAEKRQRLSSFRSANARGAVVA